MDGHRIEQLVRNQDAFEMVWQLRRRRRESLRRVAKRRGLRSPRGGAGLDEVKLQRLVDGRVGSPNLAQDIRRQAAVPRAGLHEIESGLGARDSGVEARGSRLEQPSHFENL